MNSTSQDYSLDNDARMLPEYWGWWFYPIDGGNMQKVNLPTFYHFGTRVGHLKSIQAGDSLFSEGLFLDLMLAETWINSFLDATSDMNLPHAREGASHLIDTVKECRQTINAGINEGFVDKKFDKLLVFRLQRRINEFELLFEREAARASIFVPSEIGTHSTEGLIDSADKNLPENVRLRIPAESRADIKEAGKCLALSIPTAAGFHILRAVEPLILAYHNKVTGTILPMRSRSWGTYITRLKKHGGDPKIIGMIGHIKDFYRNPIMHPEETLTPDLALSLFYTCLSAIVQLDAVI